MSESNPGPLPFSGRLVPLKQSKWSSIMHAKGTKLKIVRCESHLRLTLQPTQLAIWSRKAYFLNVVQPWTQTTHNSGQNGTKTWTTWLKRTKKQLKNTLRKQLGGDLQASVQDNATYISLSILIKTVGLKLPHDLNVVHNDKLKNILHNAENNAVRITTTPSTNNGVHITTNSFY